MLKVPGHPRSEVLQSGAVLHNTGRDLPGVPVHLQPHRQAPCYPLLPPTPGNRPVTCHELLRTRHQGEHCVKASWEEKKNDVGHSIRPAPTCSDGQQPVGNSYRKDSDAVESAARLHLWVEAELELIR